ncbi:hypothetical protein POM88_015706 [Heracleum sosnowskyi]|uniref:Glutamyl/glutaminyl-tRNA synthetase class Ib catalytic domain-containing protein n=1 Tax=Heracleum sosnowskyi TaxID=360622 RepID=A0AAD8MXN6_9APIA|nr:hypothetical protein POM88_015706 [Heracleum sosnowskyi]
MEDKDMKLRYPPDSLPLSVITTAKVAGISISGTDTILCYLGRVSTIIHGLYKRDDHLECSKTDEWLDYAPVFVPDLAIWFALVVTGRQRDNLRNSKKYPNLGRWFNSVLVDYGALSQVTTQYAGKKEQKGSNVHANGDVGKAGSRATNEVDLPHAEDGKVCLRFAPEPSGYIHMGLNQYFVDRYHGKVIIRFDDTNPAKESNEFVDNLLIDIRTLGIK